METEKIKGFVFLATDIKRILTDATPWLKMIDNQTFFVKGVEEDKFIPGTRVNTKVVGILGDIDENSVDIVFERITADDEGTSKTFSIPVAVETTKDVVREKFVIPYILAGTYATMQDGEIDILTDEERVFKDLVDGLLDGRTDRYAELFRKDNVKTSADRELVLLHKIKSELKQDPTLREEPVSPNDLVAYLIDATAAYVQSGDELEQMLDGYAKLLEQKKDNLKTDKDIRALEKESKVLSNKIEEVRSKNNYYNDVINTVILPILS